jgi:ABC-type branched-subunit amino acid transport system ATPase component
MAASSPPGGQDQVKLRVDNLHLHFGGMMALGGVSFDVKEGEILAIIGPNGAGKTCTLNCINGFYRPQRGEIFYEGEKITLYPPHRIAELGISRTFQNIELFTGLSTLDNLMAARHIHMRRGALAGFFYFGPMRREEIAHRRVVEDIIDFLELESVRKKTVGLLPYGLRKRVELGRALAQVKVVWQDIYLRKEGDYRVGVKFVEISPQNVDQLKKFFNNLEFKMPEELKLPPNLFKPKTEKPGG